MKISSAPKVLSLHCLSLQIWPSGGISNATRLSARGINQLAHACISHQKQLSSHIWTQWPRLPSRHSLFCLWKANWPLCCETGIHAQSGQKGDACWTQSKMRTDLEVKPGVSHHYITPNHPHQRQLKQECSVIRFICPTRSSVLLHLNNNNERVEAQNS